MVYGRLSALRHLIFGISSNRPSEMSVLIALLLTGAVLSFPTEYRYNYNVVQSIDLFGKNFYLFSILYYCCVAWIIYAGSRLNVRDKFASLVLSICIAFINTEFWNLRVNSPIPISDGQLNHAYIVGLVANAHIYGLSQGLNFFASWPGMQLVAATLQETLHVSTTDAMVLQVSGVIAITAVASYLFFFEMLHSPALSLVGVLLLTGFSTHFQVFYFTPSNMAYAILLLGLWLTSRVIFSNAGSFKMLTLITLMGLGVAVTNFLTMLLFTVVVTALWLTMSGKRTLSPLVPLLGASLMIPTVYGGGLMVVLSSGLNFLHGGFYSEFASFYQSKVGGPVPVWVSDITLFWQLLFAIPAIIGIVLLAVRRSKLNKHESLLCKCLLALVPYGILLATGNVYVVTPLAAIPLFSIPLMLGWLNREKSKKVVTVLVIVFVVLSLPTFLAYNRSQEYYKIYPQNLESYVFVLNGLNDTGDATVILMGIHQLPYFSPGITQEDPATNALTQHDFWKIWFEVLGSLGLSQQQNSILIFSKDSIGPWYPYLGINPSNVNWTVVQRILTQRALIYNNGFSQEYT
jgi:hypothetical protein